MKRRRVAIAASVGAAVVAAGVVTTVLLLRESPADRSRKAASALLAGMEAAARHAPELIEPFRCARFEPVDPDEPPRRVVEHGGLRYEVRGHTLSVSKEEGAELVIAVVADARGARQPTLENLAALRKQLVESGVELVISLGGQGRDRSELASVLSALALDATWSVVAIPGDREAIPDHRAAIDQVDDAVRGIVFDGSEVRFIEFGDAVIATFPGVAYDSQLVAGTEGCVHTADDATALVEALGARDGLRIVTSYAPPRQHGPDGSDRTRDGIHVGERVLAEAMAAAPPTLVLHGLVEDGTRSRADGDHAADDGMAVVAAGSLEAAPDPLRHRTVTSSAIIARVGPKRVRWRRVVVDQGR